MWSLNEIPNAALVRWATAVESSLAVMACPRFQSQTASLSLAFVTVDRAGVHVAAECRRCRTGALRTAPAERGALRKADESSGRFRFRRRHFFTRAFDPIEELT